MGSFLSAIKGDSYAESHIDRSIDNGEHHIPTERDAKRVEDVLLQFLPLELVKLVLDEAEYWPALICHRQSTQNIHGLHYPLFRANHCYFISPRLPGSSFLGGSRLTVRKVVYRLISRDQGIGGDPGLTEPYAGSLTWFEAAIIRGLGGDDDIDNPAMTARLVRGSSLRSEDGETADIVSEHEGAFQVDNLVEGSKVWHLQTNVRASRTEGLHEITWRDEGLVRNGNSSNEVSDRTGQGPGHGFVRELTAGDRIAIYARAQGPGWINHVRGIEIQIYYSI